MSRLNPHNPAIAGLEWLPTRRFPRALTIGKGIGVQFVSTATETVDVVIANIAPAGVGGSAQVGLDIYDASSVGVTETITGGTAQAAIDGAQTAGWEQSNDSEQTFSPIVAGNAWSFVNKIITEDYDSTSIAVIMAGIGRVLRFRPTGTQTEGHLLFQHVPNYYHVDDATQAGNSPAGRRIAWIEVTAAMRAQNGASPTVDGWIRIGDTNYGSDDGPRRIAASWQRYTWRFAWNPATGRQWYTTDVTQFQASGLMQFGVSVAGAQAGVDFRLGAVDITYRSLPEHRAATSYGFAPATLDANYWTAFIMQSRATFANQTWPKQNGHEYLCVFYMTGAGGNASLVGLDQAALAENPNGVLTDWIGADQPMLQAGNHGTAIPSANATFSSWAPAMYMTTTAPSGGADFQTYTATRTLGVSATVNGIRGQVISTHATATYGEATLVLAHTDPYAAQTDVPDAPLVAQLKTVSGNTPVGGTISIAPSEIPADGRWHAIKRHFSSSASLLAGTSYYLSLTSTSTAYWSCLYVATDLTFTDAASSISGNILLPGGAANVQADLLASVNTAPAPPTGLSATLGSLAQSPVPACAPTSIKYAILNWTSTSLGTDFLEYQVDRSTDAGTTWDRIAHITLEASSYFNDFESLRGVNQAWRVRVIRADQASSDWTTQVTLTVTTTNPIDNILTCNAAPQLSVAYQEDGEQSPLHTYARYNGQTGIVHAIEGRDAPVGFRSTEGRADVQTRRLIIAADTTAAIPLAAATDRQPFDKLVDLIEEPALPYVALIDGRARRWFTFPQIVGMPYDWRLHLHMAEVQFTETATAPAVWSGDTPPIP